MIEKDFLADYGLTQYALAKALHISRSRLTNIIKGRRGITADIALRLSRYFGNSAEFWLNLQIEYDLKAADTERIEAEIVPRAPVLTGIRLPIDPSPAKNFLGLVSQLVEFAGKGVFTAKERTKLRRNQRLTGNGETRPVRVT
jgi:addiction module HigA family antidote